MYSVLDMSTSKTNQEEWELEFIRTGNESVIPEDKREDVVRELQLLFSLASTFLSNKKAKKIKT